MQKILFIFALVFPIISGAVDLPEPQVPEKEALLGWQPKPYDIDELNFKNVQTKPFTCKSQWLTPLSSDQSTKRYHKFVWSGYDQRKITGRSEVCRVPQKSNPKFCLRADTAEYVILSDTYRDDCGNHYRGFWSIIFLSSHESMGTLCSLGRTIYEKPDAQFPGEFVNGPTYKVEKSKFLFLTEPFASDFKN